MKTEEALGFVPWKFSACSPWVCRLCVKWIQKWIQLLSLALHADANARSIV